MGYKSFEELEVYKAAREFRKKIYRLIKYSVLQDIERIPYGINR